MQSMGSQRVGPDLATDQEDNTILFYLKSVLHCFPANIKESFTWEKRVEVDNTYSCIFTNLYKQNPKAI